MHKPFTYEQLRDFVLKQRDNRSLNKPVLTTASWREPRKYTLLWDFVRSLTHHRVQRAGLFTAVSRQNVHIGLDIRVGALSTFAMTCNTYKELKQKILQSNA